MVFDLSTLNEEQIKSVLDTEGAVLVTAGAGSGKTRLLTHRIAYLIENNGVAPYEILAITFTNKAAKEMKERLEQMLGAECGVWVSTFHSMCVRILRRYICHLDGYTSCFSIYGESEKESCIKKIIKKLDIDDDGIFKTACSAISNAKTYGLSPDEYSKEHKWDDDAEQITQIYREYEKELLRLNSLDYDDLLNKAHYLLKTDAEAREYYQNKFRYIHVDEFQDTNTIQYDIVKLLAGKHKNVFVVGDEDQSIYGWRGANFRNIFDFKTDFSAKVYKLERNYRSTGNVLELANRIIKNNAERLEKKLWTDKPDGEKVKLYIARSDGDEADFVMREIAKLTESGEYKFSDIAVLMRINSLSRAFEERLRLYGVPHRVYGGFKFYERKEIKDLLGYLKILANKADDEALLRIINVPKRGIGDGTVTQLRNYAAVMGKNLFDVILEIENNPDLPRAVIKKVLPFSNVMQAITQAQSCGKYPLSDVVRYIIKIIGLSEFYGDGSDESESKKNNIRELVAGIEQFEKSNPSGGLEDYLQMVSLYSDLDEMDEESGCVSLATVHSAKGLEFKVVFVIGMEEGVFPCEPRGDRDDMGEERRLMYVAVTRAMERLYLTMSVKRYRVTRSDDGRSGFRECMQRPSRFLKEGGLLDDETDERIRRENSYSAYSEKYGFRSQDGGRGYGGYRGYERKTESRGRAYNDEVVPDYEPSVPRPAIPKKPKKNPADYSVGTRVVHKKFGAGTVTKINTDKETYVEVSFDGVGKLMLMLDYAPLEIVK